MIALCGKKIVFKIEALGFVVRFNLDENSFVLFLQKRECNCLGLGIVRFRGEREVLEINKAIGFPIAFYSMLTSH